ncbi:hypothetical protein HY772_01785 [Candidatus Woesearchaeota archaeon]|nr:hypothetical protein [Candidatus Woesearchaeota archaeon]
MNRSSILEQTLTEQQTVHEFAHILDYHGIRGIYDDPQKHWNHRICLAVSPPTRELMSFTSSRTILGSVSGLSDRASVVATLRCE